MRKLLALLLALPTALLATPANTVVTGIVRFENGGSGATVTDATLTTGTTSTGSFGWDSPVAGVPATPFLTYSASNGFLVSQVATSGGGTGTLTATRTLAAYDARSNTGAENYVAFNYTDSGASVTNTMTVGFCQYFDASYGTGASFFIDIFGSYLNSGDFTFINFHNGSGSQMYVDAHTITGKSTDTIVLVGNHKYWFTILGDTANNVCKLAVYDVTTTPYTVVLSANGQPYISIAQGGRTSDYAIYSKIGRCDATGSVTNQLDAYRYYSAMVYDYSGAFPLLPGESRVPFKATALQCPSVSSSSIALSWTDNLAPDGGGMNTEVNYTIQRSTDNSTWSSLTTSAAANATSYTDSTCSASTLYYYRVFATNTFGSAPASDSAFATTSPAPGAPQAGSYLTRVRAFP